MTERRDDQGYAVAPIRLGDPSSKGSGRRRRLSAILVLCACLGIAGVAVVGPRLADRPNFDVAFFATPTPGLTASPSASPTPFRFTGATPLPAFTRTGAGSISGRLGISSDQLRVLDLAAGTASIGMPVNLGSDAIVTAPDGVGWTCVCIVDNPAPNNRIVRSVDVVSINPDGSQLGRTTVATYEGDVDENSSSGVQTDVVFAADHRSALLVAGVRSGRTWSYSAARIDLDRGEVGPAIPIGGKQMPAPPPTPSVAPGETPNPVQTDVYGPLVRRSPDGRTAFVWATLQQYNQDRTLAVDTFGWRIDLDGAGSPMSSEAVPGLSELAPWCAAAGFLRNDQFVSVCPFYPLDPNSSEPPVWKWLELDPGGTVTSRAVLPSTTNYYTDPLYDTANAAVWLWDPTRLTLIRAADHGRSVVSQTFDPLVEQAPGKATSPAVSPVWTRVGSSVDSGTQTEMAGAPDGSRLYLLGYRDTQDGRRNGPASLGVFVVDPATMALVSRWAPDAGYISIQSVLGGSAVAAAGAPGADADGNDAPWEASLTIHDVATGRILMRFGQLGENWSPLASPP